MDEETEAQGGYQVVQTSLVITETVFILYAVLIFGPHGLGMGPTANPCLPNTGVGHGTLVWQIRATVIGSSG